jgi:DNA-binding NtrC family response regulator
MSRERTVPYGTSGVPLGTLRAEVVKGPDAGKTLVASSDVLTIGTAPGNDLVLTDETVSRYHLELKLRGDRIAVQDLGSTNGTAQGPTMIERGLISPGAILTLGKTQLAIAQGAPSTVEVYLGDRLGKVRGRSPAMQRLLARIDRAARSDVSVLLLGETGTGKEVIANAIHEASTRAGKPFETVDCGSLMPTLIASELFGHEKGAFTGADRQHVGAFERADGGTLFLDEIGELPASLQPALLGALERRSFRRVGGQKPINVDVRLVAATHRDLRAEVNTGAFRQDLYYRIAVVLLEIPPLRERAEDIPLLIEHFLAEAGWTGPVAEVVPAPVMKQLAAHHWPGNVRELRNFVEAALALGEAPGLAARPEGEAEPGAMSFGALLEQPYADAKASLLESFEVQYLQNLMARTNGNISGAAREAKMNRSYLLEMLKRHSIR